LEGYEALDPPILSMEHTGIIEYRNFLYSLVAKSGKADALKHHCCVKIPALLNAMALSCDGTKVMMKQDHLIKFITDAMNAAPGVCHESIQSFHNEALRPILSKFKDSEKRWLHEAEQLCHKYAKYNAGGHKAFVRHDGKWETGACRKANWNRDLIKIVIPDIRPIWHRIYESDDGAKSFFTHTTQPIGDLLEKAHQQMIFEMDGSHHKTFWKFSEGIYMHRKDFEQKVRTLETDVHRKLK
jgi:hypothetical protein